MTALEYSGPHQGVQRVGGRPPMSRRSARDEDAWRGVEYTSPYPGMMRVAGRPVAARRPDVTTLGDTRHDDDTGGSPEYWRQRRRHELAAERRANPDVRLFGCAVPYDQVLPDPARGERLRFSTRTEWLSDKYPPLRIDHGPRPLGVATLAELGIGLYVDATIPGPLAKSLGDRRQLSVAISAVRTRPRPDGTLEVEAARLDEISLVRAAAWQPYTNAVLTTVAA